MYYVLKYVAWILVALTISYRRVGKRNIPPTGPLLVVANHMSVSDPVLVGIALGRRVTFLAKEELFKNPWSAYFVRQFGAIPVYRGRLNRAALSKTQAILGQDGVIGLFPEGQRSKNGAMIHAQPGSALIAAHNRVLILPVGITGTEKIRGLNWLKLRPSVLVNIGKPFYLPDRERDLNGQKLDFYSELIMRRIAELLPEQYRGVYGGTEK